MIDLTHETALSLAAAARLLPAGRNGRKCHLSTLLRWILHGCHAPGGQLVRLDAIRLGDRWLTSREAIQRFAEALTPRLDESPVPAVRSTTHRQRASERAAAELERMGA